MDVPRTPRKKPNRWLLVGAGLAALTFATIALSRVEPAVPAIDRGTVAIDTVRQGPLVRQVRGPGQLVPEQIRYVTTLTPGRVERVHVRAGTQVTPETVLLELANPDVHIQALEADQQLTAAQAQLVALRLELESGVWNQEAALATAEREREETARQARNNDELAKRGLIARIEVDRARERDREQATRTEVETKRLALLRSSVEGRLAVQKEQVARLAAISRFQKEQVASMDVRAGAEGVVQELSLEVGQWVMPGMTLAVVAQAGNLKAVLRIAETDAKEIVLGQSANVDTRGGVAKGRVSRIDPAVVNGTVTVDVTLEGPLPEGARADMSVDGTIEIERLKNVLSVGRPPQLPAGGAGSLYRLEKDGRHAVRVPVRLGKSSVRDVEVVGGLAAGDVVVVSDMSAWDRHARVRIR
jgi:multidrug efflux pump subunit AcrA (membrane-fusion protein)